MITTFPKSLKAWSKALAATLSDKLVDTDAAESIASRQALATAAIDRFSTILHNILWECPLPAYSEMLDGQPDLGDAYQSIDKVCRQARGASRQDVDWMRSKMMEIVEDAMKQRNRAVWLGLPELGDDVGKRLAGQTLSLFTVGKSSAIGSKSKSSSKAVKGPWRHRRTLLPLQELMNRATDRGKCAINVSDLVRQLLPNSSS